MQVACHMHRFADTAQAWQRNEGAWAAPNNMVKHMHSVATTAFCGILSSPACAEQARDQCRRYASMQAMLDPYHTQSYRLWLVMHMNEYVGATNKKYATQNMAACQSTCVGKSTQSYLVCYAAYTYMSSGVLPAQKAKQRHVLPGHVFGGKAVLANKSTRQGVNMCVSTIHARGSTTPPHLF